MGKRRLGPDRPVGSACPENGNFYRPGVKGRLQDYEDLLKVMGTEK